MIAGWLRLREGCRLKHSCVIQSCNHILPEISGWHPQGRLDSLPRDTSKSSCPQPCMIATRKQATHQLNARHGVKYSANYKNGVFSLAHGKKVVKLSRSSAVLIDVYWKESAPNKLNAPSYSIRFISVSINMKPREYQNPSMTAYSVKTVFRI